LLLILESVERGFECEGCGDHFKFEFTLSRHQKLNCRQKNECDYCKGKFACRKTLLYHQQYNCVQKVVGRSIGVLFHSVHLSPKLPSLHVELLMQKRRLLLISVLSKYSKRL